MLGAKSLDPELTKCVPFYMLIMATLESNWNHAIVYYEEHVYTLHNIHIIILEMQSYHRCDVNAVHSFSTR